MKGIVLTTPGFEDVCSQEINEIIQKHSEIKGKLIIFDADKDDLIKLCYLSRSSRKVYSLIQQSTNLLEDCGDVSFLKDKTFSLRAKGEPDFAAEISKVIEDKSGGEHKFRNPDIHLEVINKEFLCLDFSTEDLGRRDYRVFLGRESIKGSTAYCLLKLADFSPKKNLADIYCKDGVIPIEAALYSKNISPHYYQKDKFYFQKMYEEADEDFLAQFDDSTEANNSIFAIDDAFNNIHASKKNAKIAGINKEINFSRKEIDWLDTKLETGSMDCLVSVVPSVSKKLSESAARSVYDKLFYQSEFILKKSGKAVFMLMHGFEILEEASKKYGFSLESSRKVMQGKQEYSVLIFSQKG